MITSKLAGHHNFYEALLEQDGHELTKIRPPLDLRSWQNLPVSSIASVRVAAITSMEKKHLHQILANHPFRHFPVILETGESTEGIMSRSQAEVVIKGGSPRIKQAITCYPDEPIREAAGKFIESSTGTILIIDRDNVIPEWHTHGS